MTSGSVKREGFTEQTLKKTGKVIKITNDDKEEKLYHKIKTNYLINESRNIAGQSLGIVAELIKGLGNIIIVTGAAIESITSSATYLTENTIRFAEDWTSMVSSSISRPNELVGNNREPNQMTVSLLKKGWQNYEVKNTERSDSFEIVSDTNIQSDDKENILHAPFYLENEKTRDSGKFASLKWFINIFCSSAVGYIHQATSETENVSSMAPHFLVVLVICVLLRNLYVRNSAFINRYNLCLREMSQVEATEEIEDITFFWRSRKVGMKEGVRVVGIKRIAQICAQKYFGLLTYTSTSPSRKIHWIGMFRRLFLYFSRAIFILAPYCVMWLYLCHNYQINAREISRNAEIRGYHAAVTSVRLNSPSMPETVTWLNFLIDQIWRVPVKYENIEDSSQKYPSYVLKAMLAFARDDGGSVCSKVKSINCISYEGLEPYISAKLGEILMESMRQERPDDVTYVSIESFTLGRSPPIIRSVELIDGNGRDDIANLRLDMNFSLNDLSVVMGKLQL